MAFTHSSHYSTMEILKNHSFYKVSLQSARGEAISALLEKAKLAAEAADQLTKELGAESRTESPAALCPGVGIGSLIFERAQSSKKYRHIGSRGRLQEYIPNMDEKKGKEIARRIYHLPGIDAEEYRAAFGLPADVKVSPSWFISADTMFLKCAYELSEEFVPIGEEEFEEERKKKEGEGML